jgi:hypothetical protein
MPEQSARAAVGDQGGGGVVLTPIRRLTLAGVGLIVGGMIVAVGTRIHWATVQVPPTPLNIPNLPRLSLESGRVTLDGSQIGLGYLSGVGLLIALVALGWLVAGPRTRLALAVAALGGAIAVAVVVAQTRGDINEKALAFVRAETGTADFAYVRITTGPGIAVTAAGAAIAGIAAVAGGAAGRSVPRMRMPEPPDRSGER